MSERYVPPPPPYQPSIQHNQKVTEEAQTLGPPKTDSSRDGQWNDSKYSVVLADKALKDAALLHSISKYPAKLESAGFRTRSRPLPSRPTGPSSPQEQGYRLDSIAEIKSHVAQKDYSIKLRSTASMVFPAPPLGEPTHRLSSSVQPSPLHYSSHSSCDSRPPLPAYPPMDPGVEPPFRHSSHASVPSPPHGSLQKHGFGIRLSFDPSVAYSDSRANAPAMHSTRQEAAASLYTSAVSSQLPRDYSNGSRQSYTSVRPALLSNETARRDDTDRRSLRSQSSRSFDITSSRSSAYTPRPKTSSGHETRWAATETDIARDIKKYYR